MTLEVIPVPGLGEVGPGSDLAAWIADHVELADGDVVVVSQKVVSKVEGALAPLHPGESVADARRRLAREEARRTVVDAPGVLIVETHHGWVCANAGVDSSNVADGWLARLPDDADASARRIRAGLAVRGVDVGVVVADTFGRPWRRGQTDVAIGLAGVPALRDERGGRDREGRPLEVTEAAIADELAAAADLVRTKASGAAVVVVRGLAWAPDEAASAYELQRPRGEDLFPRGRGMLARDLATGSARLGEPRPGGHGAVGPVGEPVRPADAELVARVAEQAGAVLTEFSGADDRDGGRDDRGEVQGVARSAARTQWRVDGDRVAAGLVVAALRDLGYEVTWGEAADALVVTAAREA